MTDPTKPGSPSTADPGISLFDFKGILTLAIVLILTLILVIAKIIF